MEIVDYVITGTPPLIRMNLNIKYRKIPTGDFIAGIIVHDRRVKDETIIIPIIGYSQDPFVAKPSSLMIDREKLTPDKKYSIRIMSRKKKDFQIESFTNPDESIFDASLAPTNKTIILLMKKDLKEIPCDRYKSVVTIKNEGKQFQIEIPIFIM
jgi:hypothetical protein